MQNQARVVESTNEINEFLGMGVSEVICQALERKQIFKPTPIQAKAIPHGLKGGDVLGIAQTGTGKTLAFGLPLLQKLQNEKGKVVVILPTRELAQQVHEALTPLARLINVNSAVLIGGVSMSGQFRDLSRKPRLIIATPGRLVDMIEQRRIDLADTMGLVLDEADRMLDMGFAPQLNQILKTVPQEKQMMLFSATMPEDILKITQKYMKNPVKIEVAPQGTPAKDVVQDVYYVPADKKFDLLEELLIQTQGPVLVFSRTKFAAKRMTAQLRDYGYTVAEIHSNRSQFQRQEALAGFKNGRFRILIATDIAARGIDVQNISLVINYDLPENSEDYVHRIGRTGRAGNQGRAVSFALPKQRRAIRDIESLMKKALNIIPLPEFKVNQFDRETLKKNQVAMSDEHYQAKRQNQNDDFEFQRPARSNNRSDRGGERRGRGERRGQGERRNGRFDRRSSEKSGYRNSGERSSRFERNDDRRSRFSNEDRNDRGQRSEKRFDSSRRFENNRNTDKSSRPARPDSFQERDRSSYSNKKSFNDNRSDRPRRSDARSSETTGKYSDKKFAGNKKDFGPKNEEKSFFSKSNRIKTKTEKIAQKIESFKNRFKKKSSKFLDDMKD